MMPLPPGPVERGHLAMPSMATVARAYSETGNGKRSRTYVSWLRSGNGWDGEFSESVSFCRDEVFRSSYPHFFYRSEE
jgi:hypothetical protein